MKTIVLRIDPIDNAQTGYPVRLLDLSGEPATVLAQSLLPATLQPATPPPDQVPWLASDQIIPTFANAAAATPVLRTIGNQLYQVLAGGDLQQQMEALADNTRLILDIRDRMLAALPWELLTQNRRRLFTDAARPICRGVQEKLAPLPLHEWPLRMLLVLGSDDPDVQAAEESQRIREALIDVDADVDLLILRRPPKSSLVEQLRQFRPHIFHFAGHGGQLPGGGDSFLRLDSDSGNVQWTGETILHDLQGVDSLRFVFLNACRTTAESQVNYWTLTDAFLEAGVPAVLGMHSDVTGADAAAFAGEIYRGLAAGKALDVAVAEARLHLINLGADALTRRGWAAPALQVHCAPDSALVVGAGIEEAQRQQVRPAFVEVRRLVDRRKERHQAWVSLRHRQIKLIVLKGEQEAGKTSFAKMLMHRCALNKHQVRYIDLQHSRRDFLTILRLIRSGAGGEPKLLTGPLNQEAFVPFNRKVNAILEAQIPPGGSEDMDVGEEILRAEHHARVPELLETFRDALKAVARESPLFLVLDHLDLPGNEFSDYLRPLLLDLCQSDINLCLVAVPTHSEGFDWQPLRDFMLEVRIDSFPEQEWVDLALDYVQRILDPTRFADDLQRRKWLADLRDKLQGLSGVIIQGPWKPIRLLGLDLLLNQ